MSDNSSSDMFVSILAFMLFCLMLTASGCNGFLSFKGEGLHFQFDGKEHVFHLGKSLK